MRRRNFIQALASAKALGALGGTALLAGADSPHAASEADYRALVVVFLDGGNDGSNCLVPTDGAYSDYAAARGELGLPKSSLVGLSGVSAGHSFGLHPALAPLAPLYESGRLAWLANAGPLVMPATAQQVLDRAVEVPPFLQSHYEQAAIQQGWMGDTDRSGWAGRALELLPEAMRGRFAAVTLDTSRVLVQGRKSAVSWLGPNVGAIRYWGQADLSNPDQALTREYLRLSQDQYANAYAAEYTRTLASGLADARAATEALQRGPVPTGNFASDTFASGLRTLAQALPAFKQLGYRRQVFLVSMYGFDTHAAQRGSQDRTQDFKLDVVARGLSAFDASNRASGVDLNVTTLVMSEFGRTLRPASGGGSDHAWGNHWFVLGGPVKGRQVIGKYPTLVLGGPDDADRGQGGRFVPTTATEQVGATVMQWMGLQPGQFKDVFPNLANFSDQTLAFMRT